MDKLPLFTKLPRRETLGNSEDMRAKKRARAINALAL
jgi:hypothetical protein